MAAGEGDKGIPPKPLPARLSPGCAATRGKNHSHAAPSQPGGSAQGPPRPVAPAGGVRPPVPPLSALSPPGGSAEPGRCSPGSRARRRPAGLLRGTTFPRPPCCSAGPREGPGCQSARVGGGSGTGIPPPAPCPANNKCFRALKAGRQVSCGRVVRGRAPAERPGPFCRRHSREGEKKRQKKRRKKKKPRSWFPGKGREERSPKGWTSRQRSGDEA